MKVKRGLTYEILALVYVAVLAAPDLLSELEIVEVDEELLVRGESIVFHLPAVFFVATRFVSPSPSSARSPGKGNFSYLISAV
jgi:hypothetical protein